MSQPTAKIKCIYVHDAIVSSMTDVAYARRVFSKAVGILLVSSAGKHLFE